MCVLVLHGHKSCAKDSKTCQVIRDNFKDVITLDYPSELSRDEIANYFDHIHINWHDVDAVIGCSLGGYWARYLGRKLMVNTIMINPALQFYGDDDKDPDDLPILLIVCDDDDVIDPSYSVNKYTGRAKVIKLNTGGHRCSTLHHCFDDIRTMINTITWVSD